MKDTVILKPENILNHIISAEKEGFVLNGRVDKDRMDRGWYGTSLEKALERSQFGCESCAQLIRKDLIHVIRKESNWGIDYNIPSDVTGPYIDPGAYSMGVPECCITPEQNKKHLLGDEGIDIVINAVVSCSVDVAVMRNRGILTAAIALICERLDLATRILVGYTNINTWNSDGKDLSKIAGNDFIIPIKDYAQPLDIPKIAFYLISPASSRRIGFALFDSQDLNSHRLSHYCAANTRYKYLRNKQIVIDHGHLRDSMLDPELAVKEAIDTLKKYGIIR